jgi:hypothetical protein
MNWITKKIVLVGLTELLGGMPKTEDLIRGQMSSKAVRLKAKALGRDPERIVAENLAAMGVAPPETGAATEAQAEAVGEEVDELMDEEKVSCGFRRNPEGLLCLGAHQIQSMLIDCATTLGLSRKTRGLKDLLTRGLQAYQGTPGGPLLILRSAGATPTIPTGTLEWGSSVQDRAGRRSVLRRYDYLLPWELEFAARWPDTKILTQEIWTDLWEMAEAQGLGAARPRGYGKFTKSD